jgi:retinoid hydroxylase
MTTNTHPQGEAKPLHELPTPPGSDGLPLVGHTLDFALGGARGLIDKVRAKVGDAPIFYVNMLGANVIYMIGPAAHQWVFSGEDKYLVNRWPNGVEQLLGMNSVSTLTGNAHRHRRGQIGARFKFEAMSAFIPMIHQTTEKHIPTWTEKDEIVAVDAIRAMLFEVIARFIFSDDAADLNLPELSKLFMQFEAGLFTFPTWDVSFLPFGKAVKARDELRAYFTKAVQKRRASGRIPDDVLTTLIQATNPDGSPLPDDQIVQEIILLLFAGHDTSVTSLTNLMMLLAQNPQVLQKARDEQKTVPAEALHTLDGLKNIPYLDAVILESMRVIPPIGGSFRSVKEDVEYQGYRIPKGWRVIVAPFATHSDPTYYPNPERFDPERIIAGQHKSQPFVHIPFGGGPRLCMGQNFAMTEIRIVLSLLLRGYQWELVPGQDLRMNTIPFPTPKSGLRVKFGRL